MTDSTLNKLWSRAVRAMRGNYCLSCGAPAHSCHHIIKRRYIVTKYDATNGIPLCQECHRIADRNSEFALQLVSDSDRLYLKEMGMYTLKDWLMKEGQTRDEFMEIEGEALKLIIQGDMW
jgi:hypothetical protein